MLDGGIVCTVDHLDLSHSAVNDMMGLFAGTISQYKAPPQGALWDSHTSYVSGFCFTRASRGD